MKEKQKWNLILRQFKLIISSVYQVSRCTCVLISLYSLYVKENWGGKKIASRLSSHFTRTGCPLHGTNVCFLALFLCENWFQFWLPDVEFGGPVFCLLFPFAIRHIFVSYSFHRLISCVSSYCLGLKMGSDR